MTRIWQCHNGHSWRERQDSDATVAVVPACPVCGSQQTALVAGAIELVGSHLSQSETTIGAQTLGTDGISNPAGPDDQTVGLDGAPIAHAGTHAPTLDLDDGVAVASRERQQPDENDQTAAMDDDRTASLERTQALQEETQALPGAVIKAAGDEPHDDTLGLADDEEDPESTLDLAQVTAGPDRRRDATMDQRSPVTPAPPRPEDRTVAGPDSQAGEERPTVRDKSAAVPRAVARRPRKDLSRSILVPGYEILGVLGRGGMGVVYKARDLRLNRVVALKMVLAGSHADADDLARFLIEAKAIAQLQHPNIVSIYEISEHEGKPFFALEYVDGGSLQSKMNGVPVKPREAAQIVETLARAVFFAHEKNIIHRDLKPANVLLTSDGAPKLTDFGLAKHIDAQDQGNTGTSAVLGTPSYMAPEQAAGRTKQMGPGGDIYSLGAVLYDLLTGRPPFRGTTVLDTLQQVQKAEPVAPGRLVPVPIDLQTICLKCLEKEPSRRYATARALADDLQRYLQGVPIHARPTPAWERGYKWVRRNPVLAALYGSIVVALGAILGVTSYFNVELSATNTELTSTVQKLGDKTRELEEAHNVLQIANEELKVETEKAQAAQQAAQQSEQEALESFQRAMKSAQKMIAEADVNLRVTPGAHQARLVMLRNAADMMTEFVSSKHNSEQVRARSARALSLLANLSEMIGQSQDADKQYGEATSLYTALIADARARKSESLADYQKELIEVLMHRWVVVEKLTPARADKVLETVHDTIERAKDDLDEPDLLRYRAALANNRGIHLQQRGDLEGALREYEQAAASWTELTKHQRTRQEHWLELAKTEINQGTVWTTLWHKEQRKDLEPYRRARKSYEAAIRQLEAVFDRVREPAFAKELGRAYLALGVLLHGNRQPYDDVFRSAVEIFDRAVKDAPRVPDFRQLQGMAAGRWGQQLLSDGRYEEAIAQLVSARKPLEKLVSDHPEVVDYQHELARCCNSLGLARVMSAPAPVGRAAAPGREPLERAYKLLDALSRQEPAHAEYRTDLDGVARNLVQFHSLEAKRHESQASWDKAKEHSEQLAAVQDARATTHLDHANAAVASGDHDEAAAALDKLFASAPPRWAKTPEALRLSAACVGLAQGDVRLGDKKQQRVQEYAKKTLERLRQAVRQGVPGLSVVLRASELDALRAHPDWARELKQLQTQLETVQ